MTRLAELHDRFAQTARELMLARGWAVDPEVPVDVSTPFLGEFTRPLGPQFVGRAMFEQNSVFAGVMQHGRMTRAPFFSAYAAVGVSFPPADRLLQLLEVKAGTLCLVELDDLVGDRALTAQLSDFEAVDQAVRQLIQVVDIDGLECLRGHATLDEFLTLCRSPMTYDRYVVPAVLAASDRRADAISALERFERESESDDGILEYGEYSRRLREWMESGAGVPGADEVPPPPPTLPRPPHDPDLWEPREQGTFAERFKETQLTHEIFRRVKDGGKGSTRDARRSMLLTELAEHGIEQDPISVEQSLDRMEMTDRESGRQGLSMLLDAGLAIVGIFTSKEDETDDGGIYGEPRWLRPPENTFPYAAVRASRTLAIDLDSGVDAWLERVIKSESVSGKMPWVPHVHVWLAWDPAPRTSESVLAAHIGPERVGSVPASASPDYEWLMAAAEAAGKWPVLDGGLARFASGAYMVQIPVPKRRQESADH